MAIFTCVILGPRGGVNWDSTRDMMRYNWGWTVFFMNREYQVERTSYIAADNLRGARDEAFIKYGSQWSWDSFRCPGDCERILPIDISDMDHIIPRVRMRVHFTNRNDYRLNRNPVGNNRWGIGKNGLLYALNKSEVFNLNALPNGYINYYGQPVAEVEYRTRSNGTEIQIRPPGMQRFSNFFSTNIILENDITNIQPMCPRCNRSKGGT